jgi:hypothetical protein
MHNFVHNPGYVDCRQYIGINSELYVVQIPSALWIEPFPNSIPTYFQRLESPPNTVLYEYFPIAFQRISLLDRLGLHPTPQNTVMQCSRYSNIGIFHLGLFENASRRSNLKFPHREPHCAWVLTEWNPKKRNSRCNYYFYVHRARGWGKCWIKGRSLITKQVQYSCTPPSWA